MFLTYERKEMAWDVLSHAIKTAGSDDYELMICDQGTEDKDYIESMDKNFSPVYFRKNKYNEGVARALNQMMIRRKHKHVFFLPNDFRLPTDWLKTALEFIEDVPDPGVVGFEWQETILPEISILCKSGLERRICCEQRFMFDGAAVMGPTFFTERLIDEIGYLDEDLGGNYGFEDQLICHRAKIAGLNSFYIPGLVAKNLCPDEDLKTNAYKQSKELMLNYSVGYYRWRAQNLHKTGIYVPAPIKRPEIA